MYNYLSPQRRGCENSRERAQRFAGLLRYRAGFLGLGAGRMVRMGVLQVGVGLGGVSVICGPS